MVFVLFAVSMLTVSISHDLGTFWVFDSILRNSGTNFENILLAIPQKCLIVVRRLVFSFIS